MTQQMLSVLQTSFNMAFQPPVEISLFSRRYKFLSLVFPIKDSANMIVDSSSTRFPPRSNSSRLEPRFESILAIEVHPLRPISLSPRLSLFRLLLLPKVWTNLSKSMSPRRLELRSISSKVSQVLVDSAFDTMSILKGPITHCARMICLRHGLLQRNRARRLIFAGS